MTSRASVLPFAKHRRDTLQRTVDCRACKGDGGFDRRHHSGNPELEAWEPCRLCFGTGNLVQWSDPLYQQGMADVARAAETVGLVMAPVQALFDQMFTPRKAA